jgi:hypothetical protein
MFSQVLEDIKKGKRWKAIKKKGIWKKDIGGVLSSNLCKKKTILEGIERRKKYACMYCSVFTPNY